MKHQWRCHIHRDGTSNCEISNNDGTFFHITSVPTKKNIDLLKYFNCTVENDSCFENLGASMPVSPFLYSKVKYTPQGLEALISILSMLDNSRMRYISSFPPGDIIKKHIVVDAWGNVTLINRQLLIPSKSQKVVPKFTSKSFIQAVVLELFPNRGEKKACCGSCICPKSTSAPTWIHTTLCRYWKPQKTTATS